MLRITKSQVIRRTIDYLTRKHPWFDAMMRNRGAALAVLVLYSLAVILTLIYVYEGDEGGWREVIKSFSPVFFDLLIIFLLSSVFLIVRGYFIEEKSRINTEIIPDKNFFLPVNASSVNMEIDDTDFFQRHQAVASILDALPIDQSDYFLAHAGSLDIPKLTLKNIEYTDGGVVNLKLGVCAFKDFFFTHHFPDYMLSRSSSRNSGKTNTLRQLFAPVYERTYASFFANNGGALELLKYTPNTLGVTGCVMLQCGEKN